MFPRALTLPAPGTETFFLWGPRQTGKSTLLRESYAGATFVDLLGSDAYRTYLARPQALREELARSGSRFVVIDEVQKLPALLDEVHWLHENRGIRFALCGSSARKVRRGGANLLGGRAVRYALHGLTAFELGDAFDLERLLNHGTLPSMFAAARPERLLRSYVGDYLRQEVAAEGLVRNLPSFDHFLGAAALSDAEIVSFATVGRECGVSPPTARSYFAILEDTLLATWLPAFTRRPKRRVIQAPKLYFADVGVVNVLARRGRIEPGSEAFGKAFENWVCHELRAYIAYRSCDLDLAYWRLASGIEVDFVAGNARVALEAKASPRITTDHLTGLRAFREDHPAVRRRAVVSLTPVSRRTEDGIDVLSVSDFVRDLWSGELLA